jgi:8-oxo-dGTP diphosphatase
VKELNLEIENCNDCPYCNISLYGGFIYKCVRPQREKDSVFNLNSHKKELSLNLKLDIPSDCPLSNKKDPGAKVGTGIILIKDKKILLGKRKNTGVGSGTWGLPGGRVDFGERAEDTAVREVKEETDLNVEKITFLTYSDDVYENEHWVTLFYITSHFTGVLENKEIDKCEEWKWFNVNCLPKNCFSGLKKVVSMYKSMIFLLGIKENT